MASDTSAATRGAAARDRIAAKQAERLAAARRGRRRRVLLQVGIGVVVLALAAVLVVVLLPRGASGGGVGGTTARSVTAQIASVPAATIDSVGAGTTALNVPTRVNGTALQSGGKPEVLYVGAEYCPYCAAERWALTQALSRFGTVSGLQLTTSSGSDVYPNTSTLTFVGAHYSSTRIAFASREIEDRDRAPLQTLTTDQTTLLRTYDAPPVVPAQSAGAIPFIYIGGAYAMGGAQLDPAVLQGKSWTQIAAAMHDPSSAIAKAEIGAANVLTAAICASTDQQPSAVCGASGVQEAKSELNG